jgi:hypothetical protein
MTKDSEPNGSKHSPNLDRKVLHYLRQAFTIFIVSYDIAKCS